MSKKDRRNLELIQKLIEEGENLFVFRVLEQGSGKWSRIIKRSSNNREDKDRVKDPLYELYELADELVSHKQAVDLRNINGSELEARTAVEIIRPKLSLLVFGGGHVGQAVALMGAILGYDVVLVDDRAEFATRSRFPDYRIKLVVGDYFDTSKSLKINSNSAVVIVTRGHQFDEVCLRNVIRSDAGYLGMIGSKRRTISVINHLKSDGFSDVDFSRLHAPIGLPIGAKSPQEIAVAIHAEIVNHFNNGNSL